jgi:uncharacterized protein DUF5753
MSSQVQQAKQAFGARLREIRKDANLTGRALRTIFGGVDVMLGQLDRLLAVATLPRVSFGVIPPGTVRRMWPGEGFFLFDDDLAVIETTSAEIKVTQPQEIRLFADAFRRLQGEAVYGAEARALISQTTRDLKFRSSCVGLDRSG